MGRSGGEQTAVRRGGAIDVEPDDARLVADLRRRAPGALARLHGRYAVGIYNLALRLVRQREDAEDITHDVLIRAYERLPRDREVRLRPWLYRITLNRCYDHLRATARHRPAHEEPERDAVAPGDPFEQAELGALFERTLETLSSRQQVALLLKDVHGLSTAELALLLEVTPGSAEVLLARARTSFRTRFAALAGVDRRSLPAWIGVGAALPLVALPPALVAPPAVPVLPAHPLPDLSPLALSAGTAGSAGVAGGGIGSALGGSAALKLAAVLAAAATVATGVSDAHHGTHHRTPARPGVVAAAPARPGTRTDTTAVARRHATPSPSPSPSVAASPSAVAVLSASPSPSPSPSDTHLGDAAPTPTPDPSASDTASPTPTPSPSDSASPSPTPSASPSATDSPTPTPSPSS
jgi:RNA polymerase sigma factor (sigma-70 family)